MDKLIRNMKNQDYSSIKNNYIEKPSTYMIL